MMRLLFILLAFLVAAPAVAQNAPIVVHQKTAPAQLKADKAYMLFESSRTKSGMMSITHIFLRIPTDDELAQYYDAKNKAYQAEMPNLVKKAKGGPVPTIDEFYFDYPGSTNTFGIRMGESLDKSNVFLVEMPAGEYVLYGVSISPKALMTCNCLGTVKFTAKPGTITYLGNIYADKVHKPTGIPQLEDNLGPQMHQYTFVLGQALVPAKDFSAVPTSLAGLPITMAELKPVPAFLEPGASVPNRLAPIPGILEYDRGRVIMPKDAAVEEAAAESAQETVPETAQATAADAPIP